MLVLGLFLIAAVNGQPGPGFQGGPGAGGGGGLLGSILGNVMGGQQGGSPNNGGLLGALQGGGMQGRGNPGGRGGGFGGGPGRGPHGFQGGPQGMGPPHGGGCHGNVCELPPRRGGPGGPRGGGMAGMGGMGPNPNGGILGSLLSGNVQQNIGGLLGGVVNGNPAAMNDLMGVINQIASIPVSIVQQATQVDVVSDLLVLRKGPRPSQQDWDRRAQKFCRRFPGHPKCRGNQVPQYTDLNSMLNVIMGSVSDYLPKVPKMTIKDPLKNVDKHLAGQLSGHSIKFGEIHKPATTGMRGACKSFKCRQQPPSAFATKQIVEAKVFEFEKKKLGRDNSDNIQLRFDRTQQLKEALLEKAQLGKDVEPLNNGVFDSDILLTEQQANFMLNELGKAGVGAEARRHPRNLRRHPRFINTTLLPEDFDPSLAKNSSDLFIRLIRKQRASVFFEEDMVKKWDVYSPIQYVLDDSLEANDKQDVRGAVQEIQSRSCLRFQEVRTAPSGYHIVYYKVDSATFCGLSYVGRNEPANPIYLSFACQNNRGIALHETLHALGMAHQHLRPDRDQYLNIDWSNVNPQMYDAFAVVDAKLFTTYGVRYDYGSIMHYNAYTGAINVAKPTMLPKYDYANNIKRLGQRDGMSNTDVELLNKMYCIPDCQDYNVYCGAWSLTGLCNSAQSGQWMHANCAKSCNLCNRGK